VGLAYKQRGKNWTFGFGAHRGGGPETPPGNPAQQLFVLVIIICNSTSKTTSGIWRIFKDLSKAGIWSIRRSIKELYSYAYEVSLKL
jgi:hypothetical protein